MLLLCILILAAYANTFHASWHFDDKPNILNNTQLHIQNLRPETLAATLYSNPKNPYEPAKKMFRPVACLTFALNWFFGQDDVFGYRVVNVTLHILTTLFLYLFVKALYCTPGLAKVSQGERQLVPILAIALWAVNPIHTQAVTYVVQRMAVLGALFYVLGLLLYLKGRTGGKPAARIAGYAGCLVCYVLALGSKENTLLMPLVIILLEFAFFQDLRKKSTHYLMILVVSAAIIVLLLAGALMFLKGDPSAIFKAYDFRPFSLTERLLTEMRVLVYYLSKIFYPIPSRLSIEHDIVLSTSLVHPWTTLPAAIFLLSWFVVGAGLLSRRPLIGFSLLFFGVNHLIESTIIPLELIFEHRNYLPSLLVFTPVAIGLAWLLDRSGDTGHAMRPILYGFMILLVIGFASGTFIRNRDWATEASIWQDASVKAPGSARPLAYLAWDLAYGENANPGNFDNALKLYGLALQGSMPKWGMKADILTKMAGIHSKKGDFATAVERLEEALVLNPDNAKARYDLAINFLQMGRWEEASRAADRLLSGKVHEGYLNLKAFILIRQGNFGEAVPYLERSLSLVPQFQTTLLYLGTAFNLSGNHAKAEQFLKKAHNAPPLSPLPMVCLVDNGLRAGNMDQAIYYAESLIGLFDTEVIRKSLALYRHNNLVPPMMLTDISRIINERL